jgi:tRNA A-37 threonylcarbamoyl transferase component Bud32/tetratricopeptide (TPR) repeat protein/TolB-like protein
MTIDRLTAALVDRYRIERELGQGGMAIVYLATDLKHHRLVAIKVLRPELAAALGSERFLREIEISAGLHHPHILSLFDSGTIPDAAGVQPALLYYIMPYVEGESLRARLNREHQLSIGDAVHIAREVADALAHAHERQFIHRDIKPENILLEGGHALVADFGIARAVGTAATTRLTATGLAIGTADYMSPEQALGDAMVDARSDVYALGCVLYEMLVGLPPFAASTVQASIARRLSEPVPRVRHVREAVPAHLEQVIMTALARVPADRFRSATEFRDAMVGGRDAPDRSARTGAPVGGPIMRRRTGLVTVAAAVLLVGAAIAWPRIAGMRNRGSPLATAVPGVAVLPFRTVGADPELWHEGIVDMLSYNLDGIGQLRKIDPVTVLTGWRRMGGSDANALSAEDALEVGRRLGSRYVIAGRAVQIGADVQLIAEVYDVESGENRGGVRVTRPADSASSLVDELTLELLRANLLPTDGEYTPPSLSRVTTSSLPALKAYLAGEREYRIARWSEAVRHYQRAIEADSSFASAWYRLSSACGWGGCPPDLNREYTTRALDLADQLPDRDGRRIRAISTGDLQALEALTARYPDDVEAWVALGESYYHAGGVTLRSTEAYRDAFTRAVRLHPYYGEAYVHLIEDAFLRLDSLDSQRLIDAYVALGGHHPCSLQVTHDLVWGDSASRERAMAVLDSVALNDCVQAPLAASPVALDRLAQFHAFTADTATQSNDRTEALFRLLQVRLPNGQIAAAREALARVAGPPVSDNRAARWVVMLHLSGFPDSAAARGAARAIASAGAPTDYFWIGALAIEEGRWSDVEAARQFLERQARDSVGQGSPSDAGAFGTALGAYAGLVRGNRSRLAEFEAALARLPVFGWDIEQPQQYLRYRVGKLLFDDGRTRDAERYFRTFQPYNFFYTSLAELYLGRIAEAHERPEEAVTHYSRFVRWWRHADQPLRPLREEAQQALDRLARE